MADGLNENADALFDSSWPKYPGAQLSVSVSNSHFLCICNKSETRPPDLTAVRTYFMRWLIHTNSYDLTHTNSYKFC